MRRVDARAASLAAFFAGALLLLALLAFSIFVYDEAPSKLPRMLAAVVRGPGALSPEDDFDVALVALGVGLHLALAWLFALAFIGVTADVRPAWLPACGVVYGMLLYGVIFHGFTQLYPWLAEMRTPDTFLAHVFFGLLLAQTYQALTDSPSG